MSRRTDRVEELLRREIADILLRGELRDPRLTPVIGISITGARVSADLGHARVFVDVMDGVEPAAQAKVARVLAGFLASAGLIRKKLQDRVELRRVPELHFEHDDAIERGARIEAVLSELAHERTAVDGDDPA